MKYTSKIRVLGLLALLAASAFATGCRSKKIIITQFPSFYKGNIRTIAVAPFRNNTRRRDAGNILSDAVAAQLATNGTYRVYNRNDLSILEDERNLRTELGMDNSKIASAFRRAGNVQAVLIGRVNTYAASQRVETKYQPIYENRPYWRRGKKYYRQVKVGDRPVRITHNEAVISVTVSLLDVADGRPIYASPSPVVGRISSTSMSRQACMTQALRQAVAKIVATFAVTKQQINVKPSKDFRVAKGLYDNKWDYTKKFSRSDRKGYIVLKLPAKCDRNRFRLTIVRKDTRTDLFSKDIVWTSKYGGFGYDFDPSEIARRAGGGGKFVAKFYSGPEPVMKTEFKIQD